MHHRTTPRFKLFSLALSSLLLLSVSACVSVDIKSKPGKKSDQYHMQEPAAPFEKMKTDFVDHAWKDESTQSVISIYSECKEDQTTNLQTIEREAMFSLSHAQVVSTQNITYNERGALLTAATGDIDGVPMKIKMLTVSKNFCNYTLMYSAREDRFEKHSIDFDKFIAGFHIL